MKVNLNILVSWVTWLTLSGSGDLENSSVNTFYLHVISEQVLRSPCRYFWELSELLLQNLSALVAALLCS